MTSRTTTPAKQQHPHAGRLQQQPHEAAAAQCTTTARPPQRTPTRHAAGATPAQPPRRRHSVADDGAAGHCTPGAAAPPQLRQEQSSPAVVQRAMAASGSLLKQVVSASGQGCAAALLSGGSAGACPPHHHQQQHASSARHAAAVWRTRAVRSKLESYCILHLKGACNRGVSLQVAFLSADSTPREVRLLHAPTLASNFRPLPAAVLSISGRDARQRLQHSLSVAPAVAVQRFLKVEFAGLALDQAAAAASAAAAGGVHAVRHLDVLQPSAAAAASAACARQLPMPPPLSGCTPDSPRGGGGAARRELSAEPSAAVLMGSPDEQASWAGGMTPGVDSFGAAAAPRQPCHDARQQAAMSPNDSLTDSQLRSLVQGRPYARQPTQHEQQQQQPDLVLTGVSRAAGEQQRQRLQQLQHDLQLPAVAPQPQRQQGAAAVLSAGGRPSTLLSLLQHSATTYTRGGSDADDSSCGGGDDTGDTAASSSSDAPAGPLQQQPAGHHQASPATGLADSAVLMGSADGASSTSEPRKHSEGDEVQSLTASEAAGLPEPTLVSSQTCVLPVAAAGPGSRLMQLRAESGAEAPSLQGRRAQSCPSMQAAAADDAASGDAAASASGDQPGKAAGSPERRKLLPAVGAAAAAGAHAWSSVTLSPEVMRRGQLVKQSCPSLAFPRYTRRSPTPEDDQRADTAAPAAPAAAAAHVPQEPAKPSLEQQQQEQPPAQPQPEQRAAASPAAVAAAGGGSASCSGSPLKSLDVLRCVLFAGSCGRAADDDDDEQLATPLLAQHRGSSGAPPRRPSSRQLLAAPPAMAIPAADHPKAATCAAAGNQGPQQQPAAGASPAARRAGSEEEGGLSTPASPSLAAPNTPEDAVAAATGAAELGPGSAASLAAAAAVAATAPPAPVQLSPIAESPEVSRVAGMQAPVPTIAPELQLHAGGRRHRTAERVSAVRSSAPEAGRRRPVTTALADAVPGIAPAAADAARRGAKSAEPWVPQHAAPLLPPKQQQQQQQSQAGPAAGVRGGVGSLQRSRAAGRSTARGGHSRSSAGHCAAATTASISLRRASLPGPPAARVATAAAGASLGRRARLGRMSLDAGGQEQPLRTSFMRLDLPCPTAAASSSGGAGPPQHAAASARPRGDSRRPSSGSTSGSIPATAKSYEELLKSHFGGANPAAAAAKAARRSSAGGARASTARPPAGPAGSQRSSAQQQRRSRAGAHDDEEALPAVKSAPVVSCLSLEDLLSGLSPAAAGKPGAAGGAAAAAAAAAAAPQVTTGTLASNPLRWSRKWGERASGQPLPADQAPLPAKAQPQQLQQGYAGDDDAGAAAQPDAAATAAGAAPPMARCPGSPAAQMRVFLPALLQPELLTPSTNEDAQKQQQRRGLSAAAAAAAAAGLASARACDRTPALSRQALRQQQRHSSACPETPPELGLASPWTGSRAPRQEPCGSGSAGTSRTGGMQAALDAAADSDAAGLSGAQGTPGGAASPGSELSDLSSMGHSPYAGGTPGGRGYGGSPSPSSHHQRSGGGGLPRGYAAAKTITNALAGFGAAAARTITNALAMADSDAAGSPQSGAPGAASPAVASARLTPIAAAVAAAAAAAAAAKDTAMSAAAPEADADAAGAAGGDAGEVAQAAPDCQGHAGATLDAAPPANATGMPPSASPCSSPVRRQLHAPARQPRAREFTLVANPAPLPSADGKGTAVAASFRLKHAGGGAASSSSSSGSGAGDEDGGSTLLVRIVKHSRGAHEAASPVRVTQCYRYEAHCIAEVQLSAPPGLSESTSWTGGSAATSVDTAAAAGGEEVRSRLHSPPRPREAPGGGSSSSSNMLPAPAGSGSAGVAAAAFANEAAVSPPPVSLRSSTGSNPTQAGTAAGSPSSASLQQQKSAASSLQERAARQAQAKSRLGQVATPPAAAAAPLASARDAAQPEAHAASLPAAQQKQMEQGAACAAEGAAASRAQLQRLEAARREQLEATQLSGSESDDDSSSAASFRTASSQRGTVWPNADRTAGSTRSSSRSADCRSSASSVSDGRLQQQHDGRATESPLSAAGRRERLWAAVQSNKARAGAAATQSVVDESGADAHERQDAVLHHPPHQRVLGHMQHRAGARLSDGRGYAAANSSDSSSAAAAGDSAHCRGGGQLADVSDAESAAVSAGASAASDDARRPRHQQQQRLMSPDRAAELGRQSGTSNSSLSFAIMQHRASFQSSTHSVAAGPGPGDGPAAAGRSEPAGAGAAGVCARRAAAAVRGSVASSCGSAGDVPPLAGELSLNDLGHDGGDLAQGSRCYGSKDQSSPTKSPLRAPWDRSLTGGGTSKSAATAAAGSKAAASSRERGGADGTASSQESCALRPPSAQDTGSQPGSSRSPGTGAAGVRLQLQGPLTLHSPRQHHAQVPGSPSQQPLHLAAASITNFSPLRAGRAAGAASVPRGCWSSSAAAAASAGSRGGGAGDGAACGATATAGTPESALSTASAPASGAAAVPDHHAIRDGATSGSAGCTQAPLTPIASVLSAASSGVSSGSRAAPRQASSGGTAPHAIPATAPPAACYSAFSPLHSRLPASASGILHRQGSGKSLPRTHQGSALAGMDDAMDAVCRNLTGDLQAAAAGAGDPLAAAASQHAASERRHSASGSAGGGVQLLHARAAAAQPPLPDDGCMRAADRDVMHERDARMAGLSCGLLQAAGVERQGSQQQPGLHEASLGSFGSSTVAAPAAMEAACAAGGPLHAGSLHSTRQHAAAAAGDGARRGSMHTGSSLTSISSSSRELDGEDPHELQHGASGQLEACHPDALMADQQQPCEYESVSGSLHLMRSSSAAALAAMRAGASTPKPIPAGADSPPDGSNDAGSASPGSSGDDSQRPRGARDEGRACRESDGVIAVLSLDGAIPPVSAPGQQQRTPPGCWEPAAGGASILGGSSPPAASSGGNPQCGRCPQPPQGAARSGPLSSGLLQRGSSHGGAAGDATAPLSPALPARGSSQCSPASAGGEHVSPRQRLEAAAAAVPERPAGGRAAPYLQQLSEAVSPRPQPNTSAAGSPLCSHRHRLQHLAQQQQLPAAQAQAGSPCMDQEEGPGTTTPASAAAPAIDGCKPCPQQTPPLQAVACPAAGLTPGATPGLEQATSSAGALHSAASSRGSPNGMARAVSPAVQQPVLLGSAAARAGGACSPGLASQASTSGAARMGRLRHRRARSDMPEYYPLSPLESPLHTAMPEDGSDDEAAQQQQQFLGAVASAAVLPLVPEGSGLCGVGGAAAAALSPQRSEPAMRCRGGALLSAEPSAAGELGHVLPAEAVAAANPLGSPLRHGLTSPAARYRLQQQQQLKGAAAVHLGSAAAAGAGGTCVQKEPSAAAAGREPAAAQHHQQQQSLSDAVAQALAAYDGSLSPRRLARIQEFLCGRASAEGGLLPPGGASAEAAAADEQQQQQLVCSSLALYAERSEDSLAQRASHDSMQLAVIKSQGALLAPQQQVAGGSAAGGTQGAGVSSLNLLASLAALGLASAFNSADSTAGSRMPRLSGAGGSSIDSEAAAALLSVASAAAVSSGAQQGAPLAHDVRLARQLVASVEQLLAPSSAAGGSSQHAAALQLSGSTVSGQQLQLQPPLGPLLAGRLAAMAAMRRLRRSSVGENDPDAPAVAPGRALQQAGMRSSGTGGGQSLRPGPERAAAGSSMHGAAATGTADADASDQLLRGSAEFSRTAVLAAAAGLQPDEAAPQHCLGTGSSPILGLGALRSSWGKLPTTAALVAALQAASLDGSAAQGGRGTLTLEEQASALLRRLMDGSSSGGSDSGSDATLQGAGKF